MTDEQPTPARDARVLLAFALFLLCIAAARSAPLKEDSCLYIDVARSLSVGRLTALHYTDYPPLYSVLIALVRPLVGGWVEAAQLVAVLSTGLGVVPLYLLGREAVGRRPALLGALAYGAHPLMVEWGATAMSDGLHLALWLTALYLGYRAAGWFDTLESDGVASRSAGSR